MVFTKITVNPEKIEYQKTIEIDVELRALIDVNNPVIGFSIKSAADSAITGTNNKIAGKNIGTVRKNEKIKISWEIDNVLNDGKYYVNVAAESENQEAFDWWEEAVLLEVYKESNTGFVVHLPIKTTIRK